MLLVKITRTPYLKVNKYPVPRVLKTIGIKKKVSGETSGKKL